MTYFHSKGEFTEIDEKFFYRFGSENDVSNSVCGTNVFADLSDSQLNNFLNKETELRTGDSRRRSKISIGIFDSDNKDIKNKEKEEYGVNSFKIHPPDISTEFLFSDDEIKTMVDGRRLYIGDEFHERSKRHNTNTNLTLGDGSQNVNKAGKRTIIELGVYDSTHQNIALTKERFAQAIFNGEIEI